MNHELKFRMGDKVKVVKSRFTDPGHGMSIGTTAVIVGIELESREGPYACDHQEYKVRVDDAAGAIRQAEHRWVAEDEIEGVV